MTREEFIKHKMRILVGEENYDKSQAFAIANSMFEQKNKAQQGFAYNYEKTGNRNITPQQAAQINKDTGIQFTPEFSSAYFSTESKPPIPSIPPIDYSKLPIQDITSTGKWTNRKVWRTQKPEWFIGKREPVEGQDYTTIPYKQWETYQSSPEYQQYMAPQQNMQKGEQVVGRMQQGGNYPSPYVDQGYPSILNDFASDTYQTQPFTSYLPSVGTTYGTPEQQLQRSAQNVSPEMTSGSSTPQPNYNDITRYNIPNLYSGIDLEGALAYAGKGFGEGNYGQAVLGTGLSALKGARNFLTGYSSGKESNRVKKEMYNDLYNPSINYAYAQQGGELTNSEMLTGQFVTDESRGNFNVENGEYIKRAKTGDVQEVVGEPHIKNGKEADGVDVMLENGDKILSDYTKIPAKNVKELKERYNLSLRKNATFADAQKAFDKKLGIQKETDALAATIEKFGKNSTVEDATTKRLNDLALSKQIEIGKKKLDLLGAPQSMMFEDLFDMQERLPKKGAPGELLDKNGKPIEETKAPVAQQGGEISQLAEKFGISLERAHELLTMQQGGKSQQEQAPQETQQPSQEQVMQFVAQSLQQGADPNQIIEQLIRSGIPHEAAMRIVQQVGQQLSRENPQQEGQPQDQNSQGENLEQEAPQQYAQEGTGFSFATRYAPPITGYDVTGRSVLNQDVLSGVEEMQPYYPAKGYGAKMANVEDTIKLHDWYFDTEAKKNAFREASKKQGEQPEVKAFQKAYNEELVKRAESAGVPKTEVNDIITKVGFSDKGVQQTDGKFGAYTSTRPLYDFKKVDGEVKAEVIPVEAVQTPITEQRNITKQAIGWLPQDLRLAPSALDPLHKEQITLGRAEPVKLTPEPQLAEAERLRQADVARIQQSGLSPIQQEALLSQGLAASQMAANAAIGQTEQANQANLAQTEQFNISQRAKEDLTNAQFSQQYQNQVLGGLNAYESALRNYYTEQNLQNRANYKTIEDINLINAENENYQYIPSMGVQYINTPTTNLALGHLTEAQYKLLTPEEVEVLKKAKAAENRVGNLKKYATTIKTV